MSKSRLDEFNSLWEPRGRKKEGGGSSPLSYGMIAAGVLMLWIQFNWGKDVAGLALLGLVAVVVFIAYQILSLAKAQTLGNQRIDEKRVTAGVERERAKQATAITKERVKIEGKLQAQAIKQESKAAITAARVTTAKPKPDRWANHK